MAIGSISFQSNISLILLSIIIILAITYFYLDTRRIKLKIDALEKNNDMFIKEVEKLNMGLHSIIEQTRNNSVINHNISNSINNNIPEEVSDSEVVLQNNEQNNEQTDEIIREPDIKNNIDEKSNNIIGEINSNNIKSNSIVDHVLEDDDNEIKEDILDDEVDDEVDDDEEIEGIDEIEGLDDIEGLDVEGLDDIEGLDVEGLDKLDNIDNSNTFEVEDIGSTDNMKSNNDIDILMLDNNDKYYNMSVKELKEKCLEMSLPVSGNKHTLAKRIVDNLK